MIFGKKIGRNKTTFSNCQFYSSFRSPMTIKPNFALKALKDKYILKCGATFLEKGNFSLVLFNFRYQEAMNGHRKRHLFF